MPFQPVSHVLKTLPQQRGWKEYQQFQRVLKIWPEVVGKAVALQTRPVGVDIRGILKVATSSSAWAQNLGFERRHILMKLNALLANSLTDIHFSSRQWQPPSKPQAAIAQGRRSQHPQEQDTVLSTLPSTVEQRDPQTAFRDWASLVQQRSRQFPLCPRCQCPTPPEELKRQGLCTLCSVRKIS